MKVARYRHGDRSGVGVVTAHGLLPAGDELTGPRPAGEELPLSEIELLSPIRQGAKIVCVGRNYAEHAEESGDTVPGEPLIFAKFPSSLIGTGEPIVLPSISRQVDFEAELGVVIGHRARNVSVAEARDHVFGYTCVNDISARDLQFGDGQWTRGKSLDTFCPTGPWVVTTDDIPDPHRLGIRCVLNDRPMQESSTAHMVFGVDELVSFISEGITLEPGDLIATGTPSGVGFTRTPPRFLAPGDVVRVEIERIGTLENRVVAQQP